MNKAISFFPILEDYQLDLLDPKIEYRFYYNDGGKIINIKNKVEDKFVTMDTKNCSWDSRYYDLNVEVTISFKNANELYGSRGIAPIESELGVGLEWYSAKDRKRDLKVCNNSILNESEYQNFTFKFTLIKDSFKNNVSIDVFIYLKKQANNITKGEEYLNNFVGVNLGTISENYIAMRGVGSLFPIYPTPLNSNLLWTVDFEYEDPFVDKFNETFRINLNTNNPNYKYLDSRSDLFNEALLIEVLTSALTLLFVKLKEEKWLDDNIFESAEDGSIINLYNYYKNLFNINTSSALDISNSIRGYFCDKEV